MLSPPTSGVFLHPTSLPGRFGIGDIGPDAFAFVDWLAGSGQSYWQFLPLGPPGDGHSPYQSLSTLAGNPLLISPEALAQAGLLPCEELRSAEDECSSDTGRVDFARAEQVKNRVLAAAYDRFNALPPTHPMSREFDDFRQGNAEWLDDFTVFMALREANGSRAWTCWDELVDRSKRPMPGALGELHDRIRFHGFVQWAFDRQWEALRQYANDRAVRLIGDLPIYVSHDGADVWANRELFQLDPEGRPAAVAGVPPDYFSETGQLWNNPLYDWEANRRQGYAWWVRRVRNLLRRVDVVRLDHFRGFQAYWEVPGDAVTAEQGQWVPGPGAELFDAIDRAIVSRSDLHADGRTALPFIAENLGHITHEVDELQRRLGLPGMVVLQFALTGAIEGDFDPSALAPNTVLYTGTHDNNTTRGWLEEEVLSSPEKHQRVRRYISTHPETVAWEVIELAWRSSAGLAMTTVQDLLDLGAASRMNRPGTTTAQHPNWSWRVTPQSLDRRLQDRLLKLTADAGRNRTEPRAATVREAPPPA